MTSSTIKKLPKSTVEVQITIPWEEVKKVYDDVLKKVSKETEMPGFRKGKAPKKVVEEKVDKKKVYEQVIKDLIPKAYQETLQKNSLKPVSNPKVQIVSAKQGEKWEIKATIALKPKIDLKNYKNKIRELKKAKVKIWTPKDGKDAKKENKDKLNIQEIVKALLEEASVEVSDLLIEQETNRLLSNLLDQTQKLGMTIDQYVMSKGMTQEKLRKDYEKQANSNLSIEFILAEIAAVEKITVSQKDIDSLVSKAKTEEEKQRLTRDSYYLAHLIRQQKTLDFLNNL